MSKAAKTEGIETLEDWRLTPQLVAWAHRRFNDPEGKLLAKIMQESEHVRLHEENPPISAERKLGRIEGWDLYHNFQKTGAKPLQTQGDMPPATFEPEEVQKQEQEKE